MRHILIVEDDIAFGTMLQTWLRRKGFEVDKATSVGAAVKLLVDMKSVDLVLSDLRLPDHDGLRLLAWMHEHSINAPFIVMTNYAEVQNAVLAMKSGAADYIAMQQFKTLQLKMRQRRTIQNSKLKIRKPLPATSRARAKPLDSYTAT